MALVKVSLVALVFALVVCNGKLFELFSFFHLINHLFEFMIFSDSKVL